MADTQYFTFYVSIPLHVTVYHHKSLIRARDKGPHDDDDDDDDDVDDDDDDDDDDVAIGDKSVNVKARQGLFAQIGET